MSQSQFMVTADVQQLIDLFEQTFFATFNTRLVAGHHEPVYLPASDICAYHQILFAYGYFASALHEIAHWCVAGEKRRQQEDYGYWYLPDGRNPQQQQQFEQVEIKSQALEWIFTQACGRKFNASTDNLNAHSELELDQVLTVNEGLISLPTTSDYHFRMQISAQARHYLPHGLPSRANTWLNALQKNFHSSVRCKDFYWSEEV